MPVRFWVVVCLVSAFAAYWPARSHACSCAGSGITSNPTNSASGVPRNQAILLNGFFDPDTIVLADLDGRAQAFELRAWQSQGPCGGSFAAELIPTPALEPETHYELRVTPTSLVALPMPASGVTPFVVRFSTGNELLPDPELARPTGRLALVKPASNTSTSCGAYAATGCLTAGDPTDDIELVLREGDKIFSVMKLTQAYQPLILWKLPTCIDLQRRAPTGRRSPPLSFCGDDLKLLARSPTECTADFFGDVHPDESEPEATTPPRAAGASGSAPHPPAQPSAEGDEPSQPMAAEPPAEHREYGCTALPRGSEPRGGLGMFALLALVALARPRRRSPR